MINRLRIAVFRYGTRLLRSLDRRLTAAGALVAGGALAATAFGIDVRQTVALQLASMLLGLLLVAMLFLLRRRPSLKVSRVLPPLATAGVPFTYTLQIENSSRSTRELELEINDQMDSRLPDAQEYRQAREPRGIDSAIERVIGLRRWMRQLRARQGALVAAPTRIRLTNGLATVTRPTLTPLRRGYLHFESTTIRRADPLGLVNAVVDVPNSDALLVLPRRYQVPALNLTGSRRYQPGGVERASRVGDSREFLSLRDYVSGDSRRHIHWRSWAHTGRPIVKQFEDQYLSRQALILDTFAGAGSGDGQAVPAFDDAIFETAVSLAASFVVAPHAADSVIDLMFIGPRAVHAQSGRSLGTQQRLLELLACVEPAAADVTQPLMRMIDANSQQIGAAIVVLLGWDLPRQRLVRKLRQRGVPLVVILVDAVDRQETDPGPMRDQTQRFCIVHPDTIERDVARLAMSAVATSNSVRQARA